MQRLYQINLDSVQKDFVLLHESNAVQFQEKYAHVSIIKEITSRLKVDAYDESKAFFGTSHADTALAYEQKNSLLTYSTEGLCTHNKS
jgi:hypothetical protein